MGEKKRKKCRREKLLLPLVADSSSCFNSVARSRSDQQLQNQLFPFYFSIIFASFFVAVAVVVAVGAFINIDGRNFCLAA